MQSSPPGGGHLQRRPVREATSFSTLELAPFEKKLASSNLRKGLAWVINIRRLSLAVFMIACAACTLVAFVTVFIWDTPLMRALRITICRGLPNAALSTSFETVPFLDRMAKAAAERRRLNTWTRLTTLVLVPGHAVYIADEWDDVSVHDEANWMLEPFQRGQVATLVKHIQLGVELTANDSTALLLFSGGQTRGGTGPRSEGFTYWTIANTANWYHYGHTGVHNRSFAEEYARDSFENILFSICRFHQITGNYPRVIKIVGFEFKRTRFVTLHRRALRFPLHRFQYFGIDPEDVGGMHGPVAHERSAAMGPFSADPYGCNTASLNDKRERRNPYLRYHPYPQGCPELSQLFQHCKRSIFRWPLPWDQRHLR